MDDKRAQLVRYIEQSKRTRRRILLAGGLGALGAIGLMIAGFGAIGMMVIVFDGMTVGIGAWITLGHLLDFQHQLKQLDGGDKSGRRPSL